MRDIARIIHHHMCLIRPTRRFDFVAMRVTALIEMRFLFYHSRTMLIKRINTQTNTLASNIFLYHTLFRISKSNLCGIPFS